MPGAPDLRRSNPLKKLVADAVYNSLVRLHELAAASYNIERIDVRRVSDLRTEIYVVRRVDSADFPPRQFTIQVIEHQ
jgi:hypothetical protein